MMKMDEEVIINPTLMLAISRMKEDDNKESQKKMMEEAFKAKFLVPCVMQMKPGTEQETKRDTTNTFVNFNMLKTKGGQMYFIGFTDMDSLKQWQDIPNQNGMIMTFEDIADMVLRAGDKAEGFVLNPMTTNLAFHKITIANILKERRTENPENADTEDKE